MSGVLRPDRTHPGVTDAAVHVTHAPRHLVVRDLGRIEYAQALDAYERWLAEVPSSSEALLGVAWMHYYLGDLVGQLILVEPEPPGATM